MEKNISKAKVLVCDDSMMVRNKMKKLLTAYGFTQIFEASDGAQAVEKFADIVPDVTFMDIVMPELSGVEALKLIKTNSPDAVVIMATSVGTVGNLSEAIKLGANDFLQKPVDEEQLYKLRFTRKSPCCSRKEGHNKSKAGRACHQRRLYDGKAG